ncbi:hypothetical protein ACFVT2_29615 [Streptomyces sp. NPDC058000]|uniref:hypothetical protein n=1 Tax=Streptomyces sp. NPDC058000 TaxID=3346299 RepID=UPI0036F0D931
MLQDDELAAVRSAVLMSAARLLPGNVLVARLGVAVATVRPAMGVGGACADEADAAENGHYDGSLAKLAHVISENRSDAISN